jgi:excisionase family DNA binding protein
MTSKKTTTTTKKKKTRRHRNLGGALTIPGAAEALKMSEYTLRRAVDRGEVESIKINGLRRIPPAEVTRLADTFQPN